jgi:hypothetical protein
MKSLHHFLMPIALLLLGSLSALAQTPDKDVKQFNKDGLSFKYPERWTLQDASTADVQQLTLSRTDGDAQIRVFVYRAFVPPDKVAEAQRVIVDPYVASTAKTFAQMGAKPESSPATTDIGAVKTDGVKIRATLDEPGAAEIYWALVGQRLVVLTFFGPDSALKQATPAWDTVRNSLTVEGPKPKPAPSPAPSPTASPTAIPKPSPN